MGSLSNQICRACPFQAVGESTPDWEIARIAARQHGVVSFRQLIGAGLGKNAIARRTQSGRLHRVRRGVYAVGHPGLSSEEVWTAAILACGNGFAGAARGSVLTAWGAALSHRSAAGLFWDLLPVGDLPVDVNCPGDGGRQKRKGIRLHRSKSLSGEHVTLRRGIPVTTPARTISDLGGVVSARLVRRATRQAEILGLLTGSGIVTDHSRSDVERDFLRLCLRHRIPRPEVNVQVGRWTVDFLWRRLRVAVETDSYRFHRGSVAFEDDHSRDLGLRSLGFEVRRYTAAQIDDSPPQVAADLRKALALDALAPGTDS
jgi:very-short-patch-repair endonuclease